MTDMGWGVTDGLGCERRDVLCLYFEWCDPDPDWLWTAELGDYDEAVHSVGVISEFRFLPDALQTESMELDTLEKFKMCR